MNRQIGFVSQEKLALLGFRDAHQLAKSIDVSLDLAYKIWRGEAKLTLGRAWKIKKDKGVSLDWIYSN